MCLVCCPWGVNTADPLFTISQWGVDSWCRVLIRLTVTSLQRQLSSVNPIAPYLLTCSSHHMQVNRSTCASPINWLASPLTLLSNSELAWGHATLIPDGHEMFSLLTLLAISSSNKHLGNLICIMHKARSAMPACALHECGANGAQSSQLAINCFSCRGICFRHSIAMAVRSPDWPQQQCMC